MVMKQYTESRPAEEQKELKPIDLTEKNLNSKIQTLEEYVQALEQEIRKNRRDINRLKDDINAITTTLRRG